MLRVIFMGTPAFAVPTLTEIVGQGHDVVACYTQPPRPAGRGMEERPSPVHQAAGRFGIPVRHPTSLKDQTTRQDFIDLDADIAVVVAYGLLLPDDVLNAPVHGCVNLHASLLPRWRGAAPINRAVMAGDTETGVAVMQMESGLDTGPVGMVERTPITEQDTASDVHDRLARLGADLMVRALGAIQRGSLNFLAQSQEGVEYAAKISKQEARIDFNKPAIEVLRHIHGLSPFPGAWTQWQPNGKLERLKILRTEHLEIVHDARPGTLLDEDFLVACGTGAIRPTLVQRAGKSAMERRDVLRGVKVSAGMLLD